MKKAILVFLTLFVVAITVTSFKPNFKGPRLYPELEAYFKSIDSKQFDKTHLESLVNIKYSISSTGTDYYDWNLIFYCSENSFRSQASQVFAQTLCFANKHKRVKIYSAGLSSGEISPKLIEYLTKIGYQISKTNQDGKPAYEVRFSDQAAPIILFSKTTTDKSLPTKDITSIIVCDVAKEANCTALKTETTPLNLPFTKVSSEDPNEKIEAELKSIATEMVYVTKK